MSIPNRREEELEHRGFQVRQADGSPGYFVADKSGKVYLAKSERQRRIVSGTPLRKRDGTFLCCVDEKKARWLFQTGRAVWIRRDLFLRNEDSLPAGMLEMLERVLEYSTLQATFPKFLLGDPLG